MKIVLFYHSDCRNPFKRCDQTSSSYQICFVCVFVNVGLFVWLTSDQPEHVLAELECENQRSLFV